MSLARRQLGASGEELAAQWYLKNGYRIVDRNWRAGRTGEIDIVACKGNTLVICEVKTRTSDKFGTPAESITHPKQMRIRQLAMAYLRDHPAQAARNLRFDVVCILGNQLDVIEDAF